MTRSLQDAFKCYVVLLELYVRLLKRAEQMEVDSIPENA